MISSLRTFVNIYVRGRHLCPSWRQIYDLHKLSKEEIVYIWSVLCLSYSSVFSCFSLSLSVRACVCVCVCVCARARASERECACVCVCVVKLLAGEVSFNQDIALSTLLVTRLLCVTVAHLTHCPGWTLNILYSNRRRVASFCF